MRKIGQTVWLWSEVSPRSALFIKWQKEKERQKSRELLTSMSYHGPHHCPHSQQRAGNAVIKGLVSGRWVSVPDVVSGHTGLPAKGRNLWRSCLWMSVVALLIPWAWCCVCCYTYSSTMFAGSSCLAVLDRSYSAHKYSRNKGRCWEETFIKKKKNDCFSPQPLSCHEQWTKAFFQATELIYKSIVRKPTLRQ